MTLTHPAVSVVVPNYNHGRFLARRLESIFGQTFQDFEVLLLDDASSDGSREILSRYAGDGRVRTVFNARNSGNVFRQWNRGVRLARAPFVWIAESDDYCEPDFLERLLPPLQAHEEVGVAFCQSRCVDEADNAKGLWNEKWAEDLRRHFEADFVAEGRAECARYFVRVCYISNASSALFRRSLYQQIGFADTRFRLCGDYDTWARMLLEADVAYLAAPLNYWRRHGATVTRRCKSSGVEIEESYRVIRRIAESAPVPREILEERLEQLADRWLVMHQGSGFSISYRQHVRILAAARKADERIFRRLRDRAGSRWCAKGPLWRLAWRCVFRGAA